MKISLASLDSVGPRLEAMASSAIALEVQDAVKAWKRWRERMESGEGKWRIEAKHREHELSVLAERIWNTIEIVEQWIDSDGWNGHEEHPMLPQKSRTKQMQLTLNFREVHSLLVNLRNVARFVDEVM